MTAETLDPADPQQAAACRRLWAAVLLHALADAERDATARAWFGTHDFRLVASLAGLDDDIAAERIDAMHRAATAEPSTPAPRRASKGTTR